MIGIHILPEQRKLARAVATRRRASAATVPTGRENSAPLV